MDQASKGRGTFLLKLKQMEDVGSKSDALAEKNESELPSTAPPPTISVSATVGKGRASILDLLKAKQLETTQSSPLPSASSSSVGRGSFLSQLKTASSAASVPMKQAVQPDKSASSELLSRGDSAEVTEKLADIAIQDSSSIDMTLPKTMLRGQQSTAGKAVALSANYITVKIDPGKAMYNYILKFSPDIESRPLRRKLLNEHLETIGKVRVFDGVSLFLPNKLPNDTTTLISTHPGDGSQVTLTLIYKKQLSINENIPFFNILLGRVMRALSLVRIGQHNFNPKGIQAIPQHKLEVWPGYVTAINEYEGGLKLCIDTKFRIMRTGTVRDLMISMEGKPNFKELVMKELIGLSVFTRYNNKTNRVDDIAWDKNPTYTFEKGGNMISLLDYYKQHWNLTIRDANQPLLVHCSKVKTTTGETQEQLMLLVPELCYIASLTDSIRSDFKVMKDIDAVTKMPPNKRRDVYRHFVQEIQNNEIPREILAQWGLRLESDLPEFTGRLLEPEELKFGSDRKFSLPAHRPADWTSVVGRQPVLRAPHLNQWCILFSQRDARTVQEFTEMFRNVSRAMGMNVRDPTPIRLRDDRTETYIQELRKNINPQMNLMVVVFPTNRSDRYSAIKRVCCVETPIPSQAIIARTISRADKLKSITEKIALQINCKLGGALWTLAIPMGNCMICGIDVYHAGTGQSTKGSVAGFVASLDSHLSTWHSKVCLQGRHQELVDMLQICMISSLKAYYKHNKRYPDRIVVYRDGVGEGQLETVTKYEVKQLLSTFQNVQPNYHPTLTVIVVHKRINTRLFTRCHSGLENPLPGTIVDNYITRKDIYDFFVVSQNVRMGTVTPTRYIVAYDDRQMKPEHIQRLTHKLCHMYYNCTGTIKVPAPCQYAHKIVSLVGQNIQMEPHPSLLDTLFYL